MARAPFFTFCVLLILVWAPTIAFFSLDTWQLIINTVTTIITFLLVALLQNTQDRSTAAINHKLDAALDGIALLLEDKQTEAAKDAVATLREMSGVELEPSNSRHNGS